MPTMPPRGIVGIIGPNGAGKTTLFQLMTGQETPDASKLRIGRYRRPRLRQSEPPGKGDKTVWQDTNDEDVITVRAAECSGHRLLFALRSRVPNSKNASRNLSGGEARPRLAKLLKSGGNVLLLDEPTTSTWRPCARLKRRFWRFRLRGGHFARPLVPGPYRDPHTACEGGVRQLCRLRRSKKRRLGDDAGLIRRA